MRNLLEKFKRRPGIKGTDEYLQDLLDNALEYAIQETKRSKEYLEKTIPVAIIDLAVIAYNRNGTEGLKLQSYSGVSEHYEEDIPKPILRKLYSVRQVKFR